MKKNRNQVIPQMFDVKPVDETGCFEVGKICRFSKVVKLRGPIKERQNNLLLRVSKSESKASVQRIKQQSQQRIVAQKIPKKALRVVQDFRPQAVYFNRFIENHLYDELYWPVNAEAFLEKKQVSEAKNSKREQGRSHFQEQAKIVKTRTTPSPQSFGKFARLAHFSPTATIPTKAVPELNEDGKDNLTQARTSETEEGRKASSSHKKEPFFVSDTKTTLEETSERIALINRKSGKGAEKRKERNKFFNKTHYKKDNNSSEGTKKPKQLSLWCKAFFSGIVVATKNSDQKAVLSWSPLRSFALSLLLVVGLIFTMRTVFYGQQAKDQVLVKGVSAVKEMEEAKSSLSRKDFKGAVLSLEEAKKKFNSASNDLKQVSGGLAGIFSHLPFLSKLSSGQNVLDAGKELAKAAQEITQAAEKLTGSNVGAEDSFFKKDSFEEINQHLLVAGEALKVAAKKLAKVKESDLPAKYHGAFLTAKKALVSAQDLLAEYKSNYRLFRDILGFSGPRKYLFVFQNNQEMRATGGFIGSYAVVDIDQGKVENILVDGIFNPDGQLLEKVVPPRPIQKISAAWSTHDANWFPDFPLSAKKIAWFYEKTGGPTVDGIIALTPAVMQKLLEITGPIEMPEYGTTVDARNFIEKTQYEVEVDYDREENRPKKFLADLTPRVLNKAFSQTNRFPQLLGTLLDLLKEKHILIYSFNQDVQQEISRRGWSGEVVDTKKDYLMVVNSNINGFKTDGVIKETIIHQAEIKEDGSVIDTVKIKRTHMGGNTPYEWWNKVNCDYMRVYVPQGSQLIEASGYTRETVVSPLDYDRLGFRRDADVEKEEQAMQIDKQTGTRIYNESGKTVFANWTYVSPGETVEIEYKYLLPFKVQLLPDRDFSGSYSLYAQKQSGSVGSEFSFSLKCPAEYRVFWKYPEEITFQPNKPVYQTRLNQDYFLGIVFQKILPEKSE